MSGIRMLWREAMGLFVDDGAFALCILAWLAVVGAATTVFALPSAMAGAALFAGLIVTLIHSVWQRAR